MDDSTMRAVKAALRRIRFSRDGDLEVEVGGGEEEGVEEPMAEEDLESSDEDMPEAEGDEYEEDEGEVELPSALRRGRRGR